MSSRSRRNKAPTMASVPTSVRAGLASLCEGNEHAVRQMLSLGTEHADLTPKLLECMGVNSLSAEMLLARFFDAQLLAEYCTQRLGKSAKGAAATLAERIAREWSKPSFVPLPLDPPSAGGAGAAGAAGVGKRDGGTGAADATLSKPAPPSEPHSAPKRQKGAAAAILPQHGHAHCRHAHRSTTLRRLLRVLLVAAFTPCARGAQIPPVDLSSARAPPPGEAQATLAGSLRGGAQAGGGERPPLERPPPERPPLRAIFSDLDGTLVHFPKWFERHGVTMVDRDLARNLARVVSANGDARSCRLLPVSTMGDGVVSDRTVELIQVRVCWGKGEV